MATTPILNLPVAVGLDGAEYVPVVQGLGQNAITLRAQVSQFNLGGSLPGSVQNANTVLAGPTSGAANYPTFRVLVPADIVVGSGMTGTVPATNGGTGQSTYAQGDLLYASATNTLAKLAKNTSATRYLSNTGASNSPAWSQIDLTNGVTGALAAANGGTGQASYTVGDLLYASGATTLTKLAKGAAYNVLRQNPGLTAPEWWTARRVLTGNLTITVASSGGDYTTPAAAYAAASQMDLNGYTITIQLADGTYTTSGVSVTTPIIGGSVVFKGNASNPSAVVFASTGSSFYVGCPYTIVVQDMTLAPSSGNALYADGPGSRINFSNIRFSGVGAGQYHMRYVSGGTISAMGNYEIVGGAPRHISGEINGAFVAAGITVTLTGTPAFSGEFILCSALASCSLFSVTYSGSATGKRYTINGNGVLNSYGAGTASTYFPGNSNGTTATGGQQL